ncbi:MAG: hypothetical protein HFG34_06745 [Eubacterium sp.]|nr:hypothetical protein [Eubacterium sp.]
MYINSNYTSNQEKDCNSMAGSKMDSFSKGIQNQIASAQKKLQDLSSRKDMSPEEKMKKRQEIQKQINDLNNQLRQYQIEQRKEKQKKKETSAENVKSAGKKETSSSTGFSQAGMEALLSADHAMDQARVQKGVAADLKGKARVLKSEIKQDARLGKDASAKNEALEKLERSAENAVASQVQLLGETKEKVSEAEDATTGNPMTGEEKQEEGKEKGGLQEKRVNVLV